jgi:hypothetical protein
LKLADQELSEAKKVIEEKSQDFQKLIDKEVDEGLVKLDVFKKELDGKIKSLQEDLGTLLSEEKLKELKEYLEGFDAKVISSIRGEIIAKLAERLKVSPEQLEQLAPILQDELSKRGDLLEKFLTQGPGQFEAFQKENDVLWQGTLSRVKDILTPQQVQELEAWRSELREKIRQSFLGKNE